MWLVVKVFNLRLSNTLKRSSKYIQTRVRAIRIFDSKTYWTIHWKAYTRICRKKFDFKDKYENHYTLVVINVKFNYTYKSTEGKSAKVKKLCKYFYENGFCVDEIHYIRCKRSTGGSHGNTCLFIDGRIYKSMTKWSNCRLKTASDLALWEPYRAFRFSHKKINQYISTLLNTFFLFRTIKIPL